ncbi:MAG: UvrD-helicase domain-containing protein [Lachnospiraceae bacterium]|nr:UvrD-helicase domain-containing protein [Lachnospiraceae bacterium]
MNLKGLNEPQQEAVKQTEGPLLILAGAGSGKTRVITHRAVYLMEEGVDPWNILCITFTNKAAREMQERIDKMVEAKPEVTVSTFHSLCLQILYRNARYLGYDPDFEICDAADQKTLIKQICKDFDIDPKKFKEKAFIAEISSAKNELVTPDDYEAEAMGDFWYELVAKVYHEYQRRLKKNNSFDFDDMIMKTVELFKKEPEILERYQDRYRYIMVDEYQDTNTAQFELIRLLAEKYRNLCVVGDDDQSIYKFRGANIRNILDFEKHYLDAMVVRLEQNYRSTQVILDAANAVISNNTGRKQKTLWTEKKEGDLIGFKQLDNAYEEADFVARDIKRRTAKGENSYKDFAILMRTNIQSKELEDAFRVHGIEYELVKGLRFWDTKVIKDLTSYLMTVASGINDVRTLRIMNVPARHIGAASMDRIAAYAMEHDMSVMDVCLKCPEEVDKIGRTLKYVKEFAQMISYLRGRAEEMSYSALLDEIVKVTGYIDYLDSESETPERFEEQKEYIDKLKEALDVYEQSVEEPDLMDFMRLNGVEGNNISKNTFGGINPMSDEEEEMDRVMVMTMHNAKGLEFPHVYLVGMEDGLFPGFGAMFSPDSEDMEEERRLCYVALTRAKETLTLCCAKRRMMKGELHMCTTSSFVKEIPLNLIDMSAAVKSSGTSGKIHGTKIYGSTGGFGGSTGSGYGSSSVGYGSTSGSSYGSSAGYGSSSGGYGASSGSGYGMSGSSSGGSAVVRRKVTAQPKQPDNAYTSYSSVMKKGAQIFSEQGLSYEVGDRVKHVKFGEGTVLEIKKGARDYEVTVDFDGYGVRKMFAAFAKLVKI